jgi:hypothetical protein
MVKLKPLRGYYNGTSQSNVGKTVLLISLLVLFETRQIGEKVCPALHCSTGISNICNVERYKLSSSPIQSIHLMRATSSGSSYCSILKNSSSRIFG